MLSITEWILRTVKRINDRILYVCNKQKEEKERDCLEIGITHLGTIRMDIGRGFLFA